MRNDVNSTAVAQSPGLSPAKQALLAKWRRGGATDAGNSAADAIPRRRGCGPAPLSLEQQRLWFFNQLETDSPLYNMPIASRLRGALHPQALQEAMDTVVARHEALRTRFVGEEPAQTIDATSPVIMLSLDLRDLPASQREAEARRVLEAEAKRPFDLTRDLMVRVVLVRMDEQEWVFLVTMHHIASDDWSWRVFCNEVVAAYEAIVSHRKPGLLEPSLQYADFSVWQKEWLRGDVLEKQLSYWRNQLEDAPPVLELPTDHPRPAAQRFHGACEWLKLSPALSEKINSLSQGGFTPFMILLAAFQTLLHRYTGQEDIVVGSPVAGRTRASLDKVIGLFVNMLVLRTKLEGNPSFADLLRRTQTTVLDALAQQDLPFEKLVEELQPQRSASYSPLIQVMFALQDELSENLKLPGMVVTPFTLDPGTAKFDLTFTIVKNASGFDCCAEYNTDLFEPTTIRRMLAHYEKLLEGVAGDTGQRLSDVPLLTEPEREELLVKWNSTEMEFPQGKCVHELFTARAAATPKAVAVVFAGRSFTYEELNWRANQLAHHLKFLGIGPESLVAVSMDRSLEMIVALLGTLKAGGAYVPLDPSYPAERLHFMLEDSKASLLLTRSSERERLGELPNGVRAICLDTDWRLISEEQDDDLRVEMTSENLAYVIYTSGSTGRPKGVEIPHRAVANFLSSMRREPGLTSTDRLLSVTSISFDIAALEIFLPLTVGACVILASSDEIFDAAKMKALLRNSGATVMQATPSFWQFLVEADWFGDRKLKILCGGEALSRELADKLLERGSEVWNLYGPTETTIWSTIAKVAPGKEPISIGFPIANTQVYVLDSHLQPVPVGVPGELYIGGEGVARGYLNRPELTAERFIPNPFRDNSGSQRPSRSAFDSSAELHLLSRKDANREQGAKKPYGYSSPSPPRSGGEGRGEVALRAQGTWFPQSKLNSAVSQICNLRGADNVKGLQHAERNSAIPQGSIPRHARLYKTGDLARHRPDGTIECLGRNDFQVKLRGHRIDLGEIESALRQHASVREAVVLLREDEPGQKHLVAYLVGVAGIGTLPQFLKTRLPDYMVPGAFVVLDKFPLTPNGKIDRKALPAPTAGRVAAEQTYTPPRTPTETTLAQIWRELLRLPQVGVDDNFFEVGGHSLLAMQLMARVRVVIQVELSLRNIFEAPTIAELAGILDKKQEQPAMENLSCRPRARRISAEHAKELLSKLDELSDSEVESLLQQVAAESGDEL